MNERTMKLRLGAAVVLSIVIIIIFLSALGSREKFSISSYTIKIQLVDAPNVVEYTPIYQSGILIGRVAKVELVPGKGVLITARIFNDHKLYHDQECHLTSTLLGDASLRMITLPKNAEGDHPHTEIKPGELIYGQTMVDPTMLVAQMQEKLTVAIDDVTDAATKLTQVATTTNDMLEENRANVKDIMINARNITSHSSTIVTNFSKILDDEFCTNIQTSVTNLREATEHLPMTMEKVDQTLDEMKNTIQLTSSTISSMTERMSTTIEGVETLVGTMNSSMVNIQKITEPFADQEVTGKWIANLTNILRNMDAFTETLNRKDTTLGLLLYDRTMYDKMTQTMSLVSELPRKLDPILFNAQVLTEKLAQHPELLGLRGALKKDSGTSQPIPWPKGITPYNGSYSNSYYSSTVYPSGNYYMTQPVLTPSTTPAARPASQPAVQPAVQPTAPSVLKSPQTGCRGNLKQAVPDSSGVVTPEMLGMTREEFQRANVQVLSDSVWNTQGTQNPEESVTPTLPPALPPVVAPSGPATGLKAPVE